MRLDKYLAERFGSRTRAARAIAEGRVTVNGRQAKASDEIGLADAVSVCEDGARGFVSEGGAKLQKALDDFGADVHGCTFADIGASTGGFTDCLLRAGAAHVFAVDVGKSQLHPSLAADARVTVMDGMNARYLTPQDFPAQPDGVVIDVSFISLRHVLPAAAGLLREGGRLFALIKPQFECEGKGLNKHGILTDEGRREEAVLAVCAFAKGCGLALQGLTEAPRKPRKNVEYVALFARAAGGQDAAALLKRLHGAKG